MTLSALVHMAGERVRSICRKGEGMSQRRFTYVVCSVLVLLMGAAGCAPAPAEDPRAQLKARNVKYSEKSFRSRAQMGDLKSVQLMLEAGMDPNVAGAHGETALRYAAASGKTGIVNALLEAGAEADIEDTDGFTPLRYAAYNGHRDIVEALLAKGAHVQGGSGDGWTPEAVAMGRGYPEIVRLLRDAQPQG